MAELSAEDRLRIAQGALARWQVETDRLAYIRGTDGDHERWIQAAHYTDRLQFLVWSLEATR